MRGFNLHGQISSIVNLQPHEPLSATRPRFDFHFDHDPDSALLIHAYICLRLHNSYLWLHTRQDSTPPYTRFDDPQLVSSTAMAHRLAVRGNVEADALSPRDANAQRLPKAAELKTKAAMTKSKNKDHPPPPPPVLPEPPTAERPDGCFYGVGKMLGKGGFAICYEGILQPCKKRFALKIVKSVMPPKMESKVR